MRIQGDIRFGDLNGDGVPDWLIGRARCFTKDEGEPEVSSDCVALIDGRRFTPLWRKNVPRPSRFPPVVAGQWAVVDVGEPVFTAFDTTRADVSWEFRMDGPLTAPMLAIGPRILLLASGDHLYYIAPNERRTIWDVRLWAAVRLPPIVSDGFVAVATERETVVLELTTGRVAWRFAGEVVGLQAVTGEGLYLTHRAPDKSLLLYAAAIGTGERTWPIERPLPRETQVLVAADQVFAFSRDRIAAFDRARGTPAWEVKTSARPVPLGSDQRIVAVLLQGVGTPQEVRAHDRETGRLLWNEHAQDRRFENEGHLVGGVLVLWSREGATAGARGGLVQGMEASTGRVLWRSEAAEKVVALLSVDAEHTRIQRERGFVVLKTRTGEEVARHPLVATSFEGKPLSERLRVLVYAVPSAIILAGIAVWIRRLLRRRR